MHECAQLMEKAISLAKAEEQALQDKDIDLLLELTEQREEVMEAAFKAKRDYDENSMRAQLLELQSIQLRISNKQKNLAETFREKIRNSTKQKGYFSQALFRERELDKYNYFNKIS